MISNICTKLLTFFFFFKRPYSITHINTFLSFKQGFRSLLKIYDVVFLRNNYFRQKSLLTHSRSLSLPPKSIRKPLFFLCFHWVKEMTSTMKCVKKGVWQGPKYNSAIHVLPAIKKVNEVIILTFRKMLCKCSESFGKFSEKRLR